MVVLVGGGGLGIEMEALVPKSFRGSVPDISSRGGHSGVLALGLWHRLPASSFNGLEKQDGWLSFFSSLGAASSDSKPEKRGRFLAQWLASRASLWSKELSSSQWQVLQRSLTLVSPRDKRQSLSLAYCESARSSSPPKCTIDTLKSGGSVVGHSIPGPGESELRVKLDSRDLSECSSSRAGDSEKGIGYWMTSSGRSLARDLSVCQETRNCHMEYDPGMSLGVVRHVELVGRLDDQGPGASCSSLDAVDRGCGCRLTKHWEQRCRVSAASYGGESFACSLSQEEVDRPRCRWNEVVVGSAAVRGGVLELMVHAGNSVDYSVVARFTAIGALTGGPVC